jgi:hypothetical protein
MPMVAYGRATGEVTCATTSSVDTRRSWPRLECFAYFGLLALMIDDAGAAMMLAAGEAVAVAVSAG